MTVRGLKYQLILWRRSRLALLSAWMGCVGYMLQALIGSEGAYMTCLQGIRYVLAIYRVCTLRCTRIYIYIYTHTHIYICIYTYAYLYSYIYRYMYMYAYIHTYVHTLHAHSKKTQAAERPGGPGERLLHRGQALRACPVQASEEPRPAAATFLQAAGELGTAEPGLQKEYKRLNTCFHVCVYI